MPAERCRVGVIYSGVPQYYVRETEQKRDGKWVVVPLFDPNLTQAFVMSESVAKTFVTKLRSIGVQNAWIEDCKDGRRIEFSSNESQQPQFGDTRTEVRATLDEPSPEERWYKLIPVNRPDGGAMWLLKCTVPGVPDPQLIYGKDPVSCLQRALDLNFLQHGERAPAPEPQQTATKNSSVVRRRPGDRYND